jgi:glycosyltransferase involved in cell wall biosynthesis
MTSSAGRPLFSVVIPTRNRATLFSVALQSVLDQRFAAFEVIVVNDGSAADHASRYREVLDRATKAVRLIDLVHTERGHGQSYALNFGVAHANGDYVCFLDDDDQWTDPDHLARAAGVIAASAARVDMVLANQKAFRNGSPVDRTVWIEDLEPRLRGDRDAAGAYSVSAQELLACQAHCHLNATIVARAFYRDLGGLDEGLRYECDRDFYLRAIDRAGLIKFLPEIVSRHNIPDPSARTSMSTAESELSKRLYQLRVFDKAALFSAHPALRHYAMRQRGYTLQYIATEARRAGRPDCARYYGYDALIAKLGLRWMDLANWISVRRSSENGALQERKGG